MNYFIKSMRTQMGGGGTDEVKNWEGISTARLFYKNIS